MRIRSPSLEYVDIEDDEPESTGVIQNVGYQDWDMEPGEVTAIEDVITLVSLNDNVKNVVKMIRDLTFRVQYLERRTRNSERHKRWIRMQGPRRKAHRSSCIHTAHLVADNRSQSVAPRNADPVQLSQFTPLTLTPAEHTDSQLRSDNPSEPSLSPERMLRAAENLILTESNSEIEEPQTVSSQQALPPANEELLPIIVKHKNKKQYNVLPLSRASSSCEILHDLIIPGPSAFLENISIGSASYPTFTARKYTWSSIFSMIRQPSMLWQCWGRSNSGKYTSLSKLWQAWDQGTEIKGVGWKPPLRDVEREWNGNGNRTWHPDSKSWSRFYFFVSKIEKAIGAGKSSSQAICELEAQRGSETLSQFRKRLLRLEATEIASIPQTLSAPLPLDITVSQVSVTSDDTSRHGMDTATDAQQNLTDATPDASTVRTAISSDARMPDGHPNSSIPVISHSHTLFLPTASMLSATPIFAPPATPSPGMLTGRNDGNSELAPIQPNLRTYNRKDVLAAGIGSPAPPAPTRLSTDGLQVFNHVSCVTSTESLKKHDKKSPRRRARKSKKDVGTSLSSRS